MNASMYKCISCNSALDFSTKREFINCNYCGLSYPVLFAQIPILISDPYAFLTRSYHQLNNFVLKKEAKLNDTYGPDQFKKFAEATEINRKIVKELCDTLETYLPEKCKQSLDRNSLNQYEMRFDYLRRDWCGYPEDEEELRIILNQIHKGLDQTKHSIGLVLGAASGRVAFELLQKIDQVIAIDNSITMPFFFKKVTETNMEFYEFNFRNAKKNDDVFVRHITAFNSFNDKGDSWFDKFNFVIGDATNCPLVSNSVDVIISTYFLDVVSIQQMVFEINRLLKPGGLIINFGPLQFHFAETSAYYTCEGIKNLFSDYGIEFLYETWITNKHLARMESMNKNIFHNWFFIARKRKKSLMNGNSILILNKAIRYTIKGEVNGSLNEDSQILIDDTATIENAGSAIVLLKLIDGEKTINKITKQFCKLYERSDAAFKGSVLGIIELLIKNGLVKLQTKGNGE